MSHRNDTPQEIASRKRKWKNGGQHKGQHDGAKGSAGRHLAKGGEAAGGAFGGENGQRSVGVDGRDPERDVHLHTTRAAVKR